MRHDLTYTPPAAGVATPSAVISSPTVRIPRYRRWLSYLTEQVLETASSPHNAYLQVSLVHGRLQLVAEDAIYSFGDYYLNFRKLFVRLAFDRLPERAEVLVLGLGLGSIPELLEKHHGRDYRYVAVEIDPVIVELAAAYSLPALDSPLEVVVADAAAFLSLDTRRYDLICVDVFQDATIPEHLNGPEFLERLRAALRPGGAVVYNRLASTAADRRAARRYYEEVFLNVYPRAEIFDSGGNFLLLNDGEFLL